MYPASYILTPRWFHKVNVFMIRLTSFPILLGIAVYERQAKQSGAFTFYETVSAAAEKIFDTLPRQLKRMTFFEGLSGPDADIDMIFELEDELDGSALGIDETSDVPPTGPIQRRISQASRRHVSGTSLRQRRPSASTGHSTPPRSASPHKTEFPAPGPSSSPQSQTQLAQPPQPTARPRAHPIITRGLDMVHAAASPLAQIFQPLIVDDDLIPEEPTYEAVDGAPSSHGDGIEVAPAATPGAVVSYGPATRRRLTSVHVPLHPGAPRRMRTYSAVGQGSQPQRADHYGATVDGSAPPIRRLPATHSPPMRSHLALFSSAPLSASPDDRSGGIPEERREEQQLEEREEEQVRAGSAGPLETAAQLENEGTPEWERRLASIEVRQKRIEELLVNISKNLGSGNK
ncbi:hypothetical protein GSI_13021 [Ganoderma sinense ZZ0214-1]|uniref:Uncharacterized protein n=1 Tax=Ganoderma sinense ZZ0214-1 TaxID=1077348 RepID=A0A2G8RUD6_9APHY|nr:hypothetical protein GSI_13021 [Ganoderma sinense ZZ0214-1]